MSRGVDVFGVSSPVIVGGTAIGISIEPSEKEVIVTESSLSEQEDTSEEDSSSTIDADIPGSTEGTILSGGRYLTPTEFEQEEKFKRPVNNIKLCWVDLQERLWRMSQTMSSDNREFKSVKANYDAAYKTYHEAMEYLNDRKFEGIRGRLDYFKIIPECWMWHGS